MEFNPALAGVKTQLEKRQDGSVYVVLSGTTPILDTFVDLILETRWSTGRLVKSYAMLLTASNNNTVAPTRSKFPETKFIEPVAPSRLPSVDNSLSSASAIPQPSSVNSKNVPVYRFDPVDANPPGPAGKPSSYAPIDPAPAVNARPEPLYVSSLQRSAAPTSSAGPTVTVPVGSTATQLLMPQIQGNVSLDQMLVALLRANPHAFINDNVNLIRAGSTVKLPTAEEAALIDQMDARKAIVAQSRDFGAYARKMASASIQVGLEESGRNMEGRVTAQVKETTGGSAVQDKLTLTKKDNQDKAEEVKIANDKRVSDENEQIVALNKNIEALNKLQSPDQSTAPPNAPVNTPVAVTPEEKPSKDWLAELTSAPNALSWAAGLLGVMLSVAFYVLRRNTGQDDFAPSHPEYRPSDSNLTRVEPRAQHGFQSGIAALDLELNAAQADAASASKMKLAEQLIAKGDHELARSLLMSLVSSPVSGLKEKAVQLLGQLK
jgi:pilus assembly protein FimV